MRSRLKISAMLGFSVLTCSAPVESWAQDLNTELAWWMEYVDDSASLGDLTIPGTHDSGALYESFSGTAKCQDLTIGEQLDIGVRYLDIRLRHIDDALVVHHGSVYQHQNFDDVLTQVTDFLATYPSEVVVMEVSEEYTSSNITRTFEETFNTYAENSAYSSYWWRHSYVPTVGDVRGKIVLLRRFSGSFWVSGGIDVTGWEDNAEFTLYDTRDVAINVQDYYQVSSWSNDNKWNEIAEHLSAAESDSAGTLFLNFTSGYRSVWGIPNIPGVADDINQRLLDYFDAVGSGNLHHGVVISDFITAEMVRAELYPFFN
jgi:1-phosphatidylinositol phosphodiesterase